MKVSGLFIYPIKSLQGISLLEAEVLERGFRYDRRWMLVDSEYRHITQRTHPELSQVSVSLVENQIQLSYNALQDLEIPLQLADGKKSGVTVWNDNVIAIEAEEYINHWFSQIIQQQCKLVFMPEDATRPVKAERSVNGENVSFADGYPYLIIGQSSLDDLNSRMEVDLPMHRFRPNIVVTETSPYEEDNWGHIQIDGVRFFVTHPCKRCVFTTIDQATGKKGAEPMKTLATYRREGNEVVFGVNTLALDNGHIAVGNSIALNK